MGRYDRPFHLARYWEQAGFEPVVITAANHHLLNRAFAPGPCQIDNVRFHFLKTPAYSGNGLTRVVNMATFAARLLVERAELVKLYGRPRLLIASSPHPYVFPSAHWLARRYEAHSVFEVRDLWPLSLVELAGVSPRHPLVRITGVVERFAYRNADTTVSLLPLAKDYMVSRGLPPQRFSYIPNGVDLNGKLHTTELAEPVNQARVWRERGAFVIVYAGALGRPNNVRTLLQAVLDIRDSSSLSVKAIVIGRGEQAQELSEMVAEREAHDVVRIYDQVSKQTIQQLFDHADAGYLSLLREPIFRFGISPNKLFDYMMAGLPVISAVDAGNDPVGESSCGISVKPDRPIEIRQAIEAIAQLPAEARVEMGKRGRRYVIENHSYANLASRYLALAES